MSEQKEEKVRGKAEGRGEKAVFLGSNKQLAKGEVLEFDNRAYEMLHRLNVEWPSMSIDFVARASPFDSTPMPCQKLEKYPVEVMTVQGSCNGTGKNSLYFTKWSRLHQTKYDDDPDAPENENEDDEDPVLVVQELETPYDVNRIRTLNNSPVVAFWSDTGRGGEVRIVDLSDRL
jgi:ribosome assembly protein RRB1